MLKFLASILNLQYEAVVSIWKVYWFFVYSIFISVVIYGAFFMLYLPSPEHVKPVHFKYNFSCENSNQVCSYPTAIVSLHDFYKPTKEAIRVLSRGQEYMINVQLDMPFSEENRNLGMFLSKIDILNKDGKTLASSERSSLFTYESNLLSIISTFFFIFPLLFGFQEQKKWMEVVLLDSFIDSSYEPAEVAKITIYSKRIQFYSARLRIKAVFSGIRYYMHQWPITFSFFAFTNILAVVTMVFLWRRGNKQEEIQLDLADDLSDSDDDVNEETDNKELTDENLCLDENDDDSDSNNVEIEEIDGGSRLGRRENFVNEEQ
ncbi:seipin isoform X4 [Hydra vulgaris]|uniref:Seipin n=2 Tax=Hydra vulgaris TaxID=6087 RepID=A0ABM4CIM6_HYDVU